MYWTCKNLRPHRPHFRWTFQLDLTALSPEDVGVPRCTLARLRSLASDARAAPALCRRLAAVQRPRLAPPGQICPRPADGHGPLPTARLRGTISHCGLRGRWEGRGSERTGHPPRVMQQDRKEGPQLRLEPKC